MSPAVRKVLSFASDWNIEIVSYGLAPNPNGFCFECDDSVPDSVRIKFSNMLDGLTTSEENELKERVF